MKSEVETLVEKLMLATDHYTGNPEADGRWLDAFAAQLRAAIREFGHTEFADLIATRKDITLLQQKVEALEAKHEQ